MSESKHSPLPWKLKGLESLPDAIVDARGFEVVSPTGWEADGIAIDKADSAFLLEAVNSHSRLQSERDEAVRLLRLAMGFNNAEERLRWFDETKLFLSRISAPQTVTMQDPAATVARESNTNCSKKGSL